MIVVGLTGSIGMGKSTTAAMFRKAGLAVHDSDAAVHSLYNGEGSVEIERLFPGVVESGRVNRRELASRVLENPEMLRRLESIVHPWVGRDRDAFLALAASRGDWMVILDVPLLFEIGGLDMVDVVVVVSAPAAVQMVRVLGRSGMSKAHFESILAKQVPDIQKRKSAHVILETGFDIVSTEKMVTAFLRSMCFHG